MKRLSCAALVVAMLVSLCTMMTSANGLASEASEVEKNQIITTEVTSTDNIDLVAVPVVETEIVDEDKDEVIEEETEPTPISKEEQQRRKDAAHEIAEQARALGLPEDDAIIVRAKELWYEAANTPVIEEEEEVMEEQPAEEVPTYTDEDLYCLANLIYYEARGCSDRHQQLVAQVCINRSKDSRFPDTIKECIEQPGQYAAWYTTANPPLEQRHIDNARAALEGNVDCPSDVIFQAEFKQGTGVYEVSKVDTGYYQSTTYFCHG